MSKPLDRFTSIQTNMSARGSMVDRAAQRVRGASAECARRERAYRAHTKGMKPDEIRQDTVAHQLAKEAADANLDFRSAQRAYESVEAHPPFETPVA